MESDTMAALIDTGMNTPDARQIAGRAEGKTVEIFGNEVCLYNFSFAGFLCELEK